MFNIADFIKETLISGVKNGAFAVEYANIMAVNYMIKGIITMADVQEIAIAVTPEAVPEAAEPDEFQSEV